MAIELLCGTLLPYWNCKVLSSASSCAKLPVPCCSAVCIKYIMLRSIQRHFT